jgi:hypothetical protein
MAGSINYMLEGKHILARELLLCLVLALLLPIVVQKYWVSVLTYQVLRDYRTSDSHILFRHALENAELPPIVEMRVSEGDSCPEGLTPLFNYSTPGYAAGCACTIRYQFFEDELVLRGLCSSELLGQGCRDVPY